jgi:hypothetical protein
MLLVFKPLLARTKQEEEKKKLEIERETKELGLAQAGGLGTGSRPKTAFKPEFDDVKVVISR